MRLSLHKGLKNVKITIMSFDTLINKGNTFPTVND